MTTRGDNNGPNPPTDDGVPQPASEAMSQEQAVWLVNRTKGQFQAFPADNGRWYLYTPKLSAAAAR